MGRMEANPCSTVVDGCSNDQWDTATDLLSDESSFYGDENTKANLEARVAAYNPKDYWDIARWNVQCMAAQAAQHLLQGTKRQLREVSDTAPAAIVKDRSNPKLSSPVQWKSVLTPAIDKLYNPHEGNASAKQLSETVDDFLSRLPPSKTGIAAAGPWIWVANPRSQRRPTNEDIAGLKQEGSKALAEYLCRKSELEEQHPDKGQASIARMLKPSRDCLESHIVKLAKRSGVTCGKWMLFPAPELVDAVWAIVVRGVVDNQLGCSAKVATDDGDPINKQRLICIYTVDFSDIEDVKRVLHKMHKLGLVETSNDRSRTIYYKCDAYTYLDIVSGNEYKLRASMYSSRDLLSQYST